MEIGVRELRANLSRWLERVKEGEEIVVTERGKPIARIVPEEREHPFDRLVAEGAITPAKRPKRPAPEPVKVKGLVSEFVIRDRR